MNLKSSRTHFVAALALGIAASSLTAFASGGATDPIPGTSKSGIKSGVKSGGGKSSGVVVTPTPAPAPAPAPQPIVVQPLTFTPTSSPGGLLPACTGSYRIDPYYPTLSLMTLSVDLSSIGEPDGTFLQVNINGTGGTLYPFTATTVYILANAGAATVSEYITPGTVITGITISDSFGNVILSGN
jgi:hypothetical protein